jgi:hypothetical protein
MIPKPSIFPAETQSVRWQIVIGLFVALSALTVLPIAITSIPPILDYPNHTARMHILAHLTSSEYLARYYRIHWTPLPDLAADAVVPILAKAMDAGIAMRIFLAGILIAMAGGCIALHRTVFCKWSLWPLSVFLLLYNRMLLWGFINYLAGLALTLWGLTVWIRLERKPIAVRIVTGAVFATFIYLAHLAAFGCYALAIAAFSIAPKEGERFSMVPALRRILPALLSLLPPVALFLMSPTSGAPAAFAYGNPLRKFDLPVSIFDNYNRAFDGTTFFILLIAVVWGLTRGGLVTHKRLGWGVLAILAAFILMPSQFLSASGIDHRLPVAIAIIGVAATDWNGLSLRRRAWVGYGLLVLLAVRLAVIGTVWVRADWDYEALLPAFELIPEGGALAVAAPARDVQAGGKPLLHFPLLAVLRRDAFVPSLFADPLQQPVSLTQSATKLAAEAIPAKLWEAIDKGIKPQLPGYDDLMIIDPPPSLDPARLPGQILFAAPRLILIHLTQSAEK